MAIRPWLENLRSRLSSTRKRSSLKLQDRASAIHHVESHEDRAMLTSTLLFLAGELQVLTDANENVTVRQDPSNANRVQVLINGTASAALPNLAPSQVQSLVVSTGDAENTVDVSGLNAAAFTNLGSITIDTGNGNDVITGSDDFAENIDAGDGNDAVDGRGGNDTLDGGNGDDTVIGGLGSDSILGGDGLDNVAGGDGNDTIDAGDGNDAVSGGIGNDSINGGDGNDTISGNAGGDFISSDLGNDSVNGDGNDDTIFGGGGNDTLSGDTGNDLATGNGGQDVISGGDGNDTLEGSAGNDSLTGELGDDSMGGGLDNDTQIGGNGNDTMFGGGGNDSMFGDGLNLISQDTGNDLIFGNSGDDTIIGGRGADTMSGDAGLDLVRSTFVDETLPPAPPAPPTPPAPPPPQPSGGATIQVLGPAIATTNGGNLGTTATLTFGAGDGSLSVTTNAAGAAGSTLFDPLGPTYPAGDPSFIHDFYLRFAGGNQTLLTAPGNTAMTGTATEARSSFAQGGLNFDLVQTVGRLDNAGGTLIGALFTQTYTITNPGNTAVSFDITRYTDYHLTNYPGVQNDGGGRIFDANGVEVFFESTNTITPGSSNAFVGVTGVGGDVITSNRFWLADLITVNPVGPLPDTIAGDTNNDGIVDIPTIDNRIAVRNQFTLAAGASATYTAHTPFGTVISLPQNVGPTGTADSGTTFADTPVTVDVVSNDSDSDGVLDYSTVSIATSPANGSAISLGNGLIVYTPNPGFTGTDTFTYTVEDDDGVATSPITVTITVNQGADNVGDQLSGDSEDDTLIGSRGNDLLVGDLGNDLIQGLGGNDTIYGGAGNDTIEGGDGVDSLFGQGGNDSLNGGDGDDVLYWKGFGQGNDTLNGANGQDGVQVLGDGSGNTYAVGQTTDGLLTVTESTHRLVIADLTPEVTVGGGGGDDSISLGDLSKLGIGLLTVNGDLGNDFIDSTNASYGKLGVRINGGGGDDTLTGSNSAEIINGDDGADIVTARAGDDTIDGGAGTDIINAGDGNDSVAGGSENDTIVGGAGNDSIDGGFDDDSITAGDGNDTVQGGFGNDSISGELGNDSLAGGIGSDFLSGGFGNDTLDGGRNDDTLSGEAGNDRLVGDHGNDVIGGSSGDDTIVGGDGNDTISGGIGRDLISGGDGNDFIHGDSAADPSQGDKDTLIGGDGNDTLVGGLQSDVLLGQQGDDYLGGQGGTDLGATGGGSDILSSVEVIDETYTLSPALLAALNGT